MRLIKPGDSGVYVQYLSLALERAGYSVGGISNEFDSRVYNSLIAFQNASSLTGDGVAGEQTWNALLPYLRGYVVVTVTAGDTVDSLAQQYVTSPGAIETANPFITQNELSPSAEVIVPLGFDVVPDNVDYSYFLVSLILDGLLARYPYITVGSAGRSVMGRNLYYIVIGSGNTEVFVNAAHHANEWITTPVVLKYAEEYLLAFSSAGQIDGFDARTLFETKKLYIMPLVNPDGVDLVNGAIDTDNSYYLRARSIAAEYPFIEFPSGWKANIEGTDLNLNYPANWQTAREIKASLGFVGPAPRDYVGMAPLSADESRTVYNFTISRNFALTISMHTQGEVIYWKYLDHLPPHSEEIGTEMSNVSGYRLESTPYSSGFAGYKDWYISFYNRPGYTVEAGIGQNPIPISQFSSLYVPCRGIISVALAEI